MELEFSQALENPNQKFEFSGSFPLEIAEDSFAPNLIVGDASVILTYFVDYDSNLHLDGSVRVPCKFVCDRCCANFSKNLFTMFSSSPCSITSLTTI